MDPKCHRQCPYGFPGGSDSKESVCNVGGLGLIPGLGRSPGGGHGNPLHYSCLETPMDRGAWRATVHGVTKSQRLLSDWAQHSTVSLWARGRGRSWQKRKCEGSGVQRDVCELALKMEEGPWAPWKRQRNRYSLQPSPPWFSPLGLILEFWPP